MKHVLVVTASTIQKTESFIHVQALAIKSQGWRVSIASGGEAHASHEIDGISQVSAPLPPPDLPRTLWARISRIMSTVLLRNREPTPAKFRQPWQDIINQAKPDLILVQFGPTAARLMPILRRTGIPWIVQFHGYDATQLTEHWGYRLTLRQIMRHASAIFACSQFLARELARFARPADCSKIHTITPGYDSIRFRPSHASREHRGPGPVRLISVGRLVEVKGHHLVIEALARTRTPVVLEIIGDGEMRAELEAQADRLGVRERVSFLGHLPHAEVVARLHSADIYVQASTNAANGAREGFGLSSVEAAATGLPVIVTDSGGLGETCCPESGIVVQGSDIAGLSTAIDSLAAAPERRASMGTHGARFVSERFASDVQARRAVARFDHCLGTRD